MKMTLYIDDGVESHLTDVQCCHIPRKIAQLGFMHVNERRTQLNSSPIVIYARVRIFKILSEPEVAKL